MLLVDVLIVGGGPAGSTLGYILQKAGLNCCIVDKACFPRKKLCGGLLTQKTHNLIDEIFGDTTFPCELVTKNVSLFLELKKLSNVRADSEFFLVDRRNFDFFFIKKFLDEKGILFEETTIKNVDTDNNTAILSSGEEIHYKALRAMSEINVVARSIYGESKNIETQKAIALSKYHRYNYKEKKNYFYNKTYGHNYKGVSLFRSDYLSLWDNNTSNLKTLVSSDAAWKNAKTLAAKLMLRQTISPPKGYTNQKFFVGNAYWKNHGKITDSVKKTGKYQGVTVYNVVVIGDHTFFNHSKENT